MNLPAYEHPPLGRHMPALDGVRGIAILVVMVSHFIIIQPSNAAERFALPLINGGGVTGVQLFFVLSGFLITGILIDARRGPHYFRNFYIRRALRIFPLYYGFLVLLLFVLPLFVDASSAEYQRLHANQAWYWTYTTNFMIALHRQSSAPLNTYHFWSLAVEEQFYLAWPLLVFLFDRAKLVWVCGLIVAGTFLLRVWLLHTGVSHLAVAEMTPTRMDALALGALIAVVARGPNGVARLYRAAWIAIPLSLAALALVFWRGGGSEAGLYMLATVGYSALAVFFGAMLVLAITAPRGSVRAWIAEHGFLRMLGRYSYCLYVIHLPIAYFVVTRRLFDIDRFPRLGASQLPAQLVYIVLMSAVSIALAWLSWHLYEKRWLAIKDLFPYSQIEQAKSATKLGTDPDAYAAP